MPRIPKPQEFKSLPKHYWKKIIKMEKNPVDFYSPGSHINSEILLWLAKVGIYMHSAVA